jgi:amino-acid N-acetyltransferase
MTKGRGIRSAEARDLPQIEALLAASSLPLEGAREAFQVGFVAEDGDRIVGAAALECYEDGALLRSVVVAASARGQGLGERLTMAAVEAARRRAAPAVYLLTTTAANFFPRLGFLGCSRDAVPPSVQQSIEFRSACPATATVLVLPLR